MLGHLDNLFEFIGAVSPPIYVACLAIVVFVLAVELVASRIRRSSWLSVILTSRIEDVQRAQMRAKWIILVSVILIIERIAADLANTEIRAENSPKPTAR